MKEQKDNVAGANVACSLQLENETNFPHQGVIDFVDNQVDVNTGTQQIRCVIANPTTVLTPGLFAVTRIPASDRYNTLLIPDAAVNTDQNERYLLIVGANNVVQRRPVELGAVFGSLRSVTEGLKPGEWVIVDGMQSARPGGRVNPQRAYSRRSAAWVGSEREWVASHEASPSSRDRSVGPRQQRSGNEDRTFLYRSSGLRDGDFDRHDYRRHNRCLHASDRAVPRDRSADRHRKHDLSGANAETIAKTVATPIEEQVNGVENMLYMSSQSDNTGSHER